MMYMYEKFKNRTDAGIKLSAMLLQYAKDPDAIILALPRGGVPVAYEVAKKLSLPLDIWLVRKLGVPGHEELAVGAISQNGARYINRNIMQALNLPEHILDQIILREKAELDRRNDLYRHGRPTPDVKGKTVIIIDDGLATGATMWAAIESLRQSHARRIVVAVPVGPKSAYTDLFTIADEVICLRMPEPFLCVGQWYADFSQTSDEEVQFILEQIMETAS